MTYVAVLAILIFTVADALSDSFLFLDFRRNGQANSLDLQFVIRRMNDNSRWHFWQAVRQATVIAAVSYLAGSLQLFFIGIAFFWLIHDGLVNLVGLGQNWFYVGTTSWIDRQFQKTKYPKATMAVAKFIFLGASIASLWIG